jgi:chemotaxis regulatin CheY-phosphate phosphatase CheZ
MTQEELDALLAGDVSDEDLLDEEPEQSDAGEMDEDDIELSGDIDPSSYKVDSKSSWPPPPPTQEHRMVHQLDEVTQDSEVKAGEVFDILETIANDAAESEKDITMALEVIRGTIETFRVLNEKFPHIETFIKELANLEAIEENLTDTIERAQNVSDQTMMAMDVMQYQDIHRQKIERVINVMRALSRYMNSLFAGKVDDEKRVSSATHIAGDSTEDTVSEDDIEALIASFGK